LVGSIAYGGEVPAYEETANFIKETMAYNTSYIRNESYGYIKIDHCALGYNVSGTYPSGGLYNITYSNLDFSSLNPRVSKVGNDYTPFIVLNFENYFQVKDGSQIRTIRTAVVNVSTAAKAQALFNAFLHLGELCHAQKNPQ
jgi:hypothetical protein